MITGPPPKFHGTRDILDHTSRNRHATQQIPSVTENHAPHPSVSQPTPRATTALSGTGFPSTYRRTGGHHGGSQRKGRGRHRPRRYPRPPAPARHQRENLRRH